VDGRGGAGARPAPRTTRQPLGRTLPLPPRQVPNRPRRSENDIKNQFYSILRRGLRQINAVIRRQLKRYKELEVDTLYRITEEGGRGRKGKEAGNSELKRTVMHYAFKNGEPTEEDAADIKKFIEQVKGIGKAKQQKKDPKHSKEEAEP
jgi:hypothetical protein